jgi:signal transduction histidine kinase/CheY-like chemotaxis protein
VLIFYRIYKRFSYDTRLASVRIICACVINRFSKLGRIDKLFAKLGRCTLVRTPLGCVVSAAVTGCHPHEFEILEASALISGAMVGIGLVSVGLGWLAWRQRNMLLKARAVIASQAAQAEELQRNRAAFIAEASHEIRTPINAVSGALDLISREALPQPVRQHLGLARAATTRLQEFVNNVLDLSKADAGRLAIHLQDEDVAAALADVVVMLRHLADHKGVQLDLDLDPAIAPRLKVDSLRLRQVVMNLLSNALKFTPRGGRVLLRVLVARESATDQGLELTVDDTGLGILPERLERLFQPYEQAHQDSSLRQPGTGLGLALCRRLMQAMGGTIQLSSRPGRGTQAKVVVTLARGSDSPPESSFFVTQPDWMEGSGTGVQSEQSVRAAVQLRVLVVEDDRVQQLLLAAELEALGCKVDIAENGDLALRLWHKHRQILVLTDCRMPVMDGVEFVRKLRELPGGQQVMVIGTSADLDSAERALEAGMQRLLPKPLPRVLLADLVSSVMVQLSSRPVLQ